MRLSEFKDEKAIEVIGNLMIPISNICKNEETSAARKAGGNMIEFVSVLLKNNSADVKNMLAILADEDPVSYHCTAGSILVDVLNMFSDPELMQLFGLQGKTAASSGSASENTEAPGQ